MYEKMQFFIQPRSNFLSRNKSSSVRMTPIKKYVAVREQAESEQQIPRILLQTFKDEYVGPKVHRNIEILLRCNPEYEYRFFTDEDAIHFIQKHFPQAVYAAFQCLRPGAAKGDLIRYCLLWQIGGVYLDMDSTFGKPLRKLVDATSMSYIGLEPDGASPVQWAMMFVPKHPLIGKLIHECVSRVLNRSHEHIFDLTGPNLYSDVLIDYMSGKKLKRVQDTLEQRRKIIQKGINGATFVPTQGDHPWQYTFRGYQRDHLYTKENPRYACNEQITYRMFHSKFIPDKARAEQLLAPLDQFFKQEKQSESTTASA